MSVDALNAPQPPPMTPQEAKAQAKAAKAYAKATRPLYKKKRVIIPAVLAAIIMITVAMNAGGDSPAPAPAAGAPAAEAPAAKNEAPAIGVPVRDGKFEFTVTRVENVGTTVGEDFLAETAQGEFVIVYVNVANIGDEGQTLESSSQKLFDAQGRSFEPSSAMFSLPNADKVFLENINPGNTITDSPLLFDVAPGTELDKIELHDSMFSDGVTVELG